MIGLTIKALNETLKEMATIYEYNEEKTAIRIENDVRRCVDSVVHIRTKDEKTGILVELMKDALERGAE